MPLLWTSVASLKPSVSSALNSCLCKGKSNNDVRFRSFFIANMLVAPSYPVQAVAMPFEPQKLNYWLNIWFSEGQETISALFGTTFVMPVIELGRNLWEV